MVDILGGVDAEPPDFDLELPGHLLEDIFQGLGGKIEVLLAGEKGSGKTLLTKYISMEVAKQGIPTIVINQALHGERFNTFIQAIEQPCVILFDEFEKIYQPQNYQLYTRRRRGPRNRDPWDDYEELENPTQDSILTLPNVVLSEEEEEALFPILFFLLSKL